MRDDFSEVAHTLHLEDTKAMPEQSTMDNCDTKGSHTTIEYRETEREDTSHLSTEPMGPEEILRLFNLDLVLMGAEGLKEEREHLNKVLLISVGRALAKACPEEVGHWDGVLPKHHSHPLSHIKPEEAALRLMPPHYRQVNEIICSTELGDSL